MTLEKLLGQNYKWWYCFIYGVKQNSAYLISDAFWYLGRLLFVFSILYVYKILDNRLLLEAVILNNIFASILSFQICHQLDSDIASGQISSLLISPSGVQKPLLFKTLGVSFRGILFNIFVFIAIFYLSGFALNWLKLLFIAFFVLIFGILLKFFADFTIGCLTFWITNGYGAISFYMTLFALLNGSLIPLNLLHPSFLYNPFAFIAYHPMQIYLGKYNPTEVLLVFLGGIFWCLVLYFLAKIVFKMGLKKNESVGL